LNSKKVFETMVCPATAWNLRNSEGDLSPCSPQSIKRIPGTSDLLVVWNSVIGPRRNPLTVAVPKDEGKAWQHLKNLEADEKYGYAYPSVTFVKDLVLITYWIYDENSSQISLKLKIFSKDWLYSN